MFVLIMFVFVTHCIGFIIDNMYQPSKKNGNKMDFSKNLIYNAHLAYANSTIQANPTDEMGCEVVTRFYGPKSVPTDPFWSVTSDNLSHFKASQLTNAPVGFISWNVTTTHELTFLEISSVASSPANSENTEPTKSHMVLNIIDIDAMKLTQER